jgi:hypothetical protein
MKLGMLHLFENPVGKSEYEVIKQQMALMYEADNLGFDSDWPAEHHFSEYGYCASPQVSLAAVAARTKLIRLGTGVVVLPFRNPIGLAEDFAFLDLMPAHDSPSPLAGEGRGEGWKRHEPLPRPYGAAPSPRPSPARGEGAASWCDPAKSVTIKRCR